MIVAILLIVVGLPTVFYVMLSTDWAQERLRVASDQALERLLGTQVEIGSIGLSPFNRVWLEDVIVHDDNGHPAFNLGRVEGRIELLDLIIDRRVVIDYVAIERLDAQLRRATPEAPLNIAGIIERLSSKEKEKKETHFELRLNDVSIANSSLSYIVESAPETPGRFNPQRVRVTDLNVAVFADELGTDSISARLQRLQLVEQSGLRLDNLSCRLEMSHSGVKLSDLLMEMPATTVGGSLTAQVPDTLQYPGYGFIGHLGREVPVSLRIDDGSHVYLPELAPFVPMLGQVQQSVDIAADLSGTVDSVAIKSLAIGDKPLGLMTRVDGYVTLTAADPADGDDTGLRVMGRVPGGNLSVRLESNSRAVDNMLQTIGVEISPQRRTLLTNLGNVDITLVARGNANDASVDLVATTASGDIDVSGTMSRRGSAMDVAGNVYFDDFDLGMLMSNDKLGHISGMAAVDGVVDGRMLTGRAAATIDHVELMGYDYADINAAVTVTDTLNVLALSIDDANVQLTADVSDRVSRGYHHLSGELDLESLRLDNLGLWHRYPGYELSVATTLTAEGAGFDAFKGLLELDGLDFSDGDGNGLKINNLTIDANTLGTFDEIYLTSDYVNGVVQGQIDLATLGREIQSILATVLPDVVALPSLKASKPNALLAELGWEGAQSLSKVPTNDFRYTVTIADAADVCRFFKIPYLVIDPVEINGAVLSSEGQAWVSVDAPYLLNGQNLQENTFVTAHIHAKDKTSYVYATTLMPTKKGDMDVVVTVNGLANTLVTNVDWLLVRDIPINGKFDFTTTLTRGGLAGEGRGPLAVLVGFNPGQINFGSDVWNIQPSQITYADRMFDIDGFAMTTDTQSINIDGRASALGTDSVTVTLDNVNLIDIFENLNIDKALIGGQATGHVYASAVFSDSICVESPDLHVRNIAYNYCTLGDGDIKVHFDRVEGDFEFDAVVHQPEGRKSYVRGSLYPATESLDFAFDADHVRVGFMQRFMSAFASSVDGYASGHARLFGTFKYIDLEGDIYADSLKVKIDFTNTWYTASDSIHLTPGLISLHDVTIRDTYGTPAKLSGWVSHEFFKRPKFDFTVSDARNFLSYDVTPKESPDWYGRIFGNGGARVTGQPGVVNIGVNMSTAPNSTFTFVLSDTEEASEYSFITFRDVTPHEIVDSIVDIEVVPQSVQIHRGMRQLTGADAPTAYNMDIQVDITPQAQMNIIMDPVGGDRIRGNGSGHLRMTYGSANNDLRMYGTYTLDRGNYNFTLQDIIIKDFTIKEGSSITFTGDPYTAQLDIDAIYQVNANLSDLDESFLQDKELNRTNVPVHALLKVTGNMMQPDIDFDLEFPTLNVDTYRKVKSIVSTEEMMNMQIIYLLALNRFYTPEYMASTTKGNELFSVASSTISSQLSSMLGKLSENWSIAPNLRSDRGDFSDLEVDLMLSSSLLNNRLLFNGNFGYREKSLNANQFIGDFDIQYLLNRAGSWRLKAYNRFNDQNYYLRTAQTTQGVGLMYRRDFDNLFSFLKKHKKKADDTKKDDAPADTIPQD